MSGWKVEQNADDDSWEAWSPGREYRVWIDDEGFCVFDVEGTQGGICTIPMGVIDQLRAKEVKG